MILLRHRYDKYLKLALKPPVKEVRIIDVRQVVVSHWVRLKCQYGCGAYNTRLTCPPFSPTPEETTKMLSEYSWGLLYTFNFQGSIELERKQRRKMRKFAANLERRMFLDGFYKAFALTAGPCNLCKKCDTSSPCKYPEYARPSMEACGIDVYKTLENVGLKIEVVRSLDDICSFCHLILIE